MIGRKLNNRFTITARLGSGAMGEVYQATDEKTEQQVAIKMLAGEFTRQPDALERFRREAETLRQLDHPNIVKFVDAFQHEGQYVIVMEYIAGGSLSDLLHKGLLPIERVRQITLDLCDALIRAHRLSIIHRDIKPENVLMAEDGTPKLADFGVARLTEGTRLTRSGTQVGTPYYMSPEAWEGSTLDAQADIWSLGIMLFEMLTGQVPFGGDTGAAVMNKVLTTRPPDLKRLRAEVPLKLVKIVDHMLTRDKKRRYPTMREVAVDLERSQDATAPVAPKAKAPPRSSAMIRLVIIAVLAAGIVIAVPKFIAAMNQGIPVASTSGPLTASPSRTEISASATVAQVANANETLASSIGSSMTGRDGAMLMYVPQGVFTMGGNSNADQKPIHYVTLDAFWMDKFEVTNARYAKCVAEGACQKPTNVGSYTHSSYYGNPEFDNYPVIYVDWNMAYSYCSWAGRELPTEAQWEKAARGTDRRTYPWGEKAPADNLLYFHHSFGDTTEVGTYPAGQSPYGVFDLAGNVWEWVNDWYNEVYYLDSPALNPLGPNAGEKRGLRGGSWIEDEHFVNSISRSWNNPKYYDSNIGFRCAVSAQASSTLQPVVSFSVTDVKYSLSSSSDYGYGNCPRVTANITTDGAGSVTYHWTRSDGALAPASSLVFQAAGTQAVTEDWALGSVWAGTSHWLGVYVDTPNHQDFGHLVFTTACTLP